MTGLHMTTLANLRPGENGVIYAVHAEESLFQRLSALGFRTGKKIELIRRANFNGPLHVRIGSTDVVLRESEARRIQIIH
jgi:ferrous iron transport protein A